MAYYTSFGAAGEVTGSCHLIKIGKIRILIDCGMFQGEESELNFKEFDFDPSDINYLIVTHAHLDHIGRIPLLVKKGFNKKIISTRATYTIAQLMLKNSAGILETKPKQLYTLADVEPALSLFKDFIEPDGHMMLDGDIKVTFKNAGHILGAVSVKLEFEDEGIEKSVVFSGDLGQDKRIITAPVQEWHSANYVFVESTYGASTHEDIEISIDSFKKQILDTIQNGGTVVIPSFALERTQEVLFLLRQMSEDGLLEKIPVFLDSPLAINVTDAFLHFPNLFSFDVMKIILDGKNPFSFKGLVHTYNKESSREINNHIGAKIIIAGSGMCEGGRVGHHLIHHLIDEKNLVLFVGFQVESTLGRRISTGDGDITILGTELHVKAKIGYVSGFSAHADQKEILNWLDAMDDLYCVYLIHGDQPQLKTLKEKIKSKLKEKAHIVKLGETIHL